MNYICFDLGGSGGKVSLASFDGGKIDLREIHKFSNAPMSVHESLYWNVFSIYHHMNAGISKAFTQSVDIYSIGIDSFCNDFALVSGRQELLTSVRCYRDVRTQLYKKQIEAHMPARELYELSGNQQAGFNTLMQLSAMNAAGQAYLLGENTTLLFLPDLLRNFLSGERTTERTIASVSQMYSFTAGDWSRKILNAFQIPHSMLTDIISPGEIAGKTLPAYNRELGIPGCKVTAVCEHDTASAFLASFVPSPKVTISSGTWALVGVEAPGPIINDFTFTHNIANEGSLPGHHRILKNVMGTWLLQQLREEFAKNGDSYTYNQLAEMAEAEKPSSAWIDVDDMVFYAPGDMSANIRKICGRHYPKSPESISELLRCVYESTALKYRYVIELLEKTLGVKIPCINIVGGGSRDAFNCQLTADICNVPVTAGPAEATSYGNVLVQMLASGEVASVEEGREIISRSVNTVTYLPSGNVEEWGNKYNRFKSDFALQ